MEIQNEYTRADRRYYPFTENNPFDSWFKKMKLQLFGESSAEFIERNQLKLKADAVYESLKIGKGKAVDTLFSATSSTWNSPKSTLSPLPNIVGLNSGAIDAFNRATAGLTERKLSAIPSLPTVGGPAEWIGHIIDKSGDTFEEIEARYNEVKNPLPSSSSNPTIIEMSSGNILDSPSTVPNTVPNSPLPVTGEDFL